MRFPLSDEYASLALRDGSAWNITVADPEHVPLLRDVADLLGLPLRRLPAAGAISLEAAGLGLPEKNGPGRPLLAALRLAGPVGRECHERGGVMLHAALIARQGWGVVLAGRGGGGKTTACRRLPGSWHVLGDELTMLVHSEGQYWAHSWPVENRKGEVLGWGCFSMEIPLKAIFILKRASTFDVAPLAPPRAVAELLTLAEEGSGPLRRGCGRDSLRRFRLKTFENIFALIRLVPVFRLSLGLEDRYWEPLEACLS